MLTTQTRVFAPPPGVPVVDETNVEAFLSPAAGEPDHALLFFPGLSQPRPEADDVAIVLPQLLRHFRGRLRGAMVARAAEDLLKGRFQVMVAPSLVVTRGLEPLGVLPKIQDWSVYVEKIEAWLRPDAPLQARARPDGRVPFVFSPRSAS